MKVVQLLYEAPQWKFRGTGGTKLSLPKDGPGEEEYEKKVKGYQGCQCG